MGWAAPCEVYEILASRFVRQAHQTPIAHLHWHNDGAEGGSIRVSEPDLDGMPRPYITTFNTKTMHFAFVETSMENWCIYFPGTSGSSFLYGFFLRVLFCASRRGAFSFIVSLFLACFLPGMLSFLRVTICSSFLYPFFSLFIICRSCFRFCSSRHKCPSGSSIIEPVAANYMSTPASSPPRRTIKAPPIPPTIEPAVTQQFK